MKKGFFLFLLLFSLSFQQLQASCIAVAEDLTISVPTAEYAGNTIRFTLANYIEPEDPATLHFRLTHVESIQSSAETDATVDPLLHVSIPCVEYQGSQYGIYLSPLTQAKDADGFFWKLTRAEPADSQINNKPTAASLSLNIDSSLPYLQQQLSANDRDNDSLLYELISPSSGTGYSSAYINPNNGILYLTFSQTGIASFSISYRVTDGQLYSDPAVVSIDIIYLSEDEKNTGRNDVDPENYSEFALSTYNSNLLGSSGEEPEPPRAIDLSSNFPQPGDQGAQGSCVGWAVAYALKSYQEKLENHWSLNTPAHLFSPAYVYNQINAGQDQGSFIYEALDLAINQGISTLETMPYSDTDHYSQPSNLARSEAAFYKAQRWSRINDTAQIKAALANRKPVVGGINVYEQLMNLQGTGSLYNTAAGPSLGGHAVTIVGYDDDRYGGAFKIINSWGVNWGDNGFFWMPYNFSARGILTEAYVLEDAENSLDPNPIPDDPTEPEPDSKFLPNLTISSWDAEYDSRPRGEGYLTFSIVNTGLGIAPQGADVNLMLSSNREITTNDYYIVYEPIPFDLEPGEEAYRDASNAIGFRFPDQLPEGTYYMALWVDDLNEVVEANENDNISRGNSLIAIENSLPDLSVSHWYADWDSYGNGTLTYEVINSGASATTNNYWDINLILDRDQTVGNGNEYYLFFEQASYFLDPGEYLYRDQNSPAYFNIYADYYGSTIPSGTYFMALWVDDLDFESESNELNNGSYSWGQVVIPSSRYGTQLNSQSPDQTLDSAVVSKAYNGKRLPPKNMIMKKVEISRTQSGQVAITVMDDPTTSPLKASAVISPSKTIKEKTGLVFPTTRRIAMPGGSPANGK